MARTIDGLLEDQLGNASVPRSDKRAACVLVDSAGNRYAGCNSEGFAYFHAEENALRLVPEGSAVAEVHMMSSVPGFKGAKEVVPCVQCMGTLAGRSSAEATLVLHQRSGNQSHHFSLHALAGLYVRYNQRGLLMGKEGSGLPEALPLVASDAHTLVTFLSKIADKETRFYLTGSASNRGGPRRKVNGIVTGNEYDDIDLVIITPNPADFSEERLREAFNGTLKARESGYGGSAHSLSRVYNGNQPDLGAESYPPVGSGSYSDPLHFTQVVLWYGKGDRPANRSVRDKRLLPPVLDISVGIRSKRP